MMATPLDKTILSVRAINGLYNSGIETVEALLAVESLEPIRRQKNIGRVTFDEIQQFMRDHGHSWRLSRDKRDNRDALVRSRLAALKTNVKTLGAMQGRLMRAIEAIQQTMRPE